MVSLDEALSLITAGQITDAKTQIALLRYGLTVGERNENE